MTAYRWWPVFMLPIDISPDDAVIIIAAILFDPSLKPLTVFIIITQIMFVLPGFIISTYDAMFANRLTFVSIVLA